MTPSEPHATRRQVAVLLPLPLPGAYDYLDGGLDLHPGDVVEVPLGGRQVIGVVTGSGTHDVEPGKLRTVIRRLAVPPLPETSLRFLAWVAAYTVMSPGAVLRMVISVPAALEPLAMATAYSIVDGKMPLGLRLTPARRRTLDLLADGLARQIPEIASEAGVSASVVKGLVTAGALAVKLIPAEMPAPVPDPDTPRASDLSAEQAAAAAQIVTTVEAAAFSVTVIDGVTGAGKTDVYFEAIAAALRQDRQVLVLLPEIALSAPFLDRFEARFGARPAEWHSELAPPRRRRTWRGVAEGSVRVLVGARSALFLPFPHLGLIIIDEEHEAAFKQSEGVPYQGRDMAVVRGRLGAIPVILVSATPSLETVINVRRGRYARVSLADRHGGAVLPTVTAIDMRRDGPERGRWIAPALERAIMTSLPGR